MDGSKVSTGPPPKSVEQGDKRGGMPQARICIYFAPNVGVILARHFQKNLK